MATWVGIDVSMETLDFAFTDESGAVHRKVANAKSGFMQLLKACPSDACFAMEATGIYYLDLALFLHEKHRHVAVINPSRIKNHLKTDLSRHKSDKADARAIARFGSEKQPPPWEPLPQALYEMRQLQSLHDLLTRQIIQLVNHLDTTGHTSIASKEAKALARAAISDLRKRQRTLNKLLEEKAVETMPDEVDAVAGVAGIGVKTAIRLLASLDVGRFSSARKLVSFNGLSPLSEQSGVSVKRRGHISRMGGANLRGPLYMCALVASQHNPQCRAMFLRMKARGKPHKVILVAIMNKLLRQVWAILHHGTEYDPNYGLQPVVQ